MINKKNYAPICRSGAIQLAFSHGVPWRQKSSPRRCKLEMPKGNNLSINWRQNINI